jgi:hypothetical protein
VQPNDVTCIATIAGPNQSNADFIAKLAAVVPKPRTNLTRFHGVFAPNSKFRVRVTPAKRGRGRKPHQPTGENWQDKTPAERHVAMTWMQRLKRVFNIDIETCERCAGQVKIIACIEDPTVIERILAHLKSRAPSTEPVMLPDGRAPPPQARLFD